MHPDIWRVITAKIYTQGAALRNDCPDVLNPREGRSASDETKRMASQLVMCEDHVYGDFKTL